MGELLKSKENANYKARPTGYNETNLSKEIGEQKSENRPVVVRTEKGDCRGEEFFQEYNLKFSLEPQMTRGYSEILLETDSKNIYVIAFRDFNQLGSEAKPTDSGWYIINARENVGRNLNNLTGAHFDTEDAMKHPVIKIGEPFKYNRNCNTSRITKVTAVDDGYFSPKNSINNLPESDIKKRFAELIKK